MTWLPAARSRLASTLKMALFPDPRLPRMIVLAPARTRSNAADSTKYFSSPRPMSRSAAGAPKSRLRMTFGGSDNPAITAQRDTPGPAVKARSGAGPGGRAGQLSSAGRPKRAKASAGGSCGVSWNRNAVTAAIRSPSIVSTSRTAAANRPVAGSGR